MLVSITRKRACWVIAAAASLMTLCSSTRWKSCAAFRECYPPPRRNYFWERNKAFILPTSVSHALATIPKNNIGGSHRVSFWQGDEKGTRLGTTSTRLQLISSKLSIFARHHASLAYQQSSSDDKKINNHLLKRGGDTPCYCSATSAAHNTNESAGADSAGLVLFDRLPFEECWRATSWTVNPHDEDAINDIVRCFNSPAPQPYSALCRALAQVSTTNIADTDEDEDEVSESRYAATRQVLLAFACTLKKGYHFATLLRVKKKDKRKQEQEQGGTQVKDDAIIEWKIVKEGDADVDVERSDYEDANEYSCRWEKIVNYSGGGHGHHSSSSSTLERAHHILELVQEASENHEIMDPVVKSQLVDSAVQHLDFTLGTSLRGRSAADAAFCFAMAGVTHPRLYDILATIAKLELERIGKRPSFQTKYILQMVEKMAASGTKGGWIAEDMHKLAADLIEWKETETTAAGCSRSRHRHSDTCQALREGTFGFHSTRSLLWLWRFAARQSKAKIKIKPVEIEMSTYNEQPKLIAAPQGKEEIIPQHDDQDDELCSQNSSSSKWMQQQYDYQDSSKPLIVDVGCGMGVSLLGLASSTWSNKQQQHNSNLPLTVSTIEEETSRSAVDVDTDSPLSHIDFEQFNYLGGDLSQLLIAYSQGIATRWDLLDKLQFTWQSANDLVDSLQSYPGPIGLIMIQFPTPFRLMEETATAKGSATGNHQLPMDANSGFMVDKSLLQQIVRVMKLSRQRQQQDTNHDSSSPSPAPPLLLLQSNCEDVAVAMKQMAESDEVGLKAVPVSNPVLRPEAGDDRLPQRTRDWVEMMSDSTDTGSTQQPLERAVGPCWSAESLLPCRGQTETEVACRLNGTPVHTILLQLS
jgi:hypothetical protein